MTASQEAIELERAPDVPVRTGDSDTVDGILVGYVAARGCMIAGRNKS